MSPNPRTLPTGHLLTSPLSEQGAARCNHPSREPDCPKAQAPIHDRPLLHPAGAREIPPRRPRSLPEEPAAQLPSHEAARHRGCGRAVARALPDPRGRSRARRILVPKPAGHVLPSRLRGDGAPGDRRTGHGRPRRHPLRAPRHAGRARRRPRRSRRAPHRQQAPDRASPRRAQSAPARDLPSGSPLDRGTGGQHPLSRPRDAPLVRVREQRHRAPRAADPDPGSARQVRRAGELQAQVDRGRHRGEPLARSQAQAGLRHPSTGDAGRGRSRRGRLSLPGREGRRAEGALGGRARRGPPELLLLQQAAHLQGPGCGDLAGGRPARRSPAGAAALRRRRIRAGAARHRRGRAHRRCQGGGGSPSGDGRGQLADARGSGRDPGSQPGDPGASGHGEVADHHQPDRRGAGRRPHDPLRGGEDGRAGGREAASGHDPPGRRLPGTAQSQDQQAGRAGRVEAHAGDGPAEGRARDRGRGAARGGPRSPERLRPGGQLAGRTERTDPARPGWASGEAEGGWAGGRRPGAPDPGFSVVERRGVHSPARSGARVPGAGARDRSPLQARVVAVRPAALRSHRRAFRAPRCGGRIGGVAPAWTGGGGADWAARPRQDVRGAEARGRGGDDPHRACGPGSPGARGRRSSQSGLGRRGRAHRGGGRGRALLRQGPLAARCRPDPRGLGRERAGGASGSAGLRR